MFVKINRSAIINTDHIVWFADCDDHCEVKLSDETEHQVAKDYMGQFKHMISMINNTIYK